MAKRRVKVKVGDVFAVPIGKGKFGFGQVDIQGEYSDCIVIYDIVSEEYPPIDSSNKRFSFFTPDCFIKN